METSDKYELAQTIKRFDSLHRVSIGIGMMLASIMLVFTYVIAWMLILPMSRSLGATSVALPLIRFQLIVGAPVFLTSAILGAIGPWMCLSARQETRSTIFILLSILTGVLSVFVMAAQMVADVPGLVDRLAVFLPPVSIFFFMLFLVRLATYLEREDIIKLVKASLAFGGVALVFAAMPSASRYAVVKTAMTRDYIAYLLPVTIFSLFLSAITFTIAFLLYVRSLLYARRALRGEPPPKPMSPLGKRIRLCVFGALIGGLAASLYCFLPLSLSRMAAMNSVLTIFSGTVAGAAISFLFDWSWEVCARFRPPRALIGGVVGLMVGAAIYLPFVPALGWHFAFPFSMALSGSLIGTLIGFLQQLRGRPSVGQQNKGLES